MNVLVLGVGGNVGQSIVKALQSSRVRCRIVGACISPGAAGLYMVDKAMVSPVAAAPEFMDWLLRICREERVDAILSGVEEVLDVLSTNSEDIRKQTGAICLVSPPQVLRIGRDKLLTCQWLRAQGLNAPMCAATDDRSGVNGVVDACGYPLIAKPRHGKGSKGLALIYDKEALQSFVGRSDYVVQEHIGDADHEYTATSLVDRNGVVSGTMVMKRTLELGTSTAISVGPYPSIRMYVEKIAGTLKPMGPCNVQMRLRGGSPVCFEINIRFSGTTCMRAHFGFNDVEAALRHYVLGEDDISLPVVEDGIALRYWDEVYVSRQEYERLAHGEVILGKCQGPGVRNRGSGGGACVSS